MCYAEGAQIRTSGLSFIHPSTGAVFGTNRSLACKGGVLGFLYALIGSGQHSLDTHLAASLSGVTAGCFTTLSLLSHYNQMSTPNKVSWLHPRITLLPIISGAIVSSCIAGTTSLIYDSIYFGPQETKSLKFW